jgi:chemotaxis signal transduction protein
MEDLDLIQRFMKEKMDVGSLIDLEKFVDMRFAMEAYKDSTSTVQRGPQQEVLELRATAGDTPARKAKKPALLFDFSAESPIQASREGKYIIFKLADERYGISVLDVREIIQMRAIRPMPCLPDYVKGVIDLRGKVIPIIDLRLKLGMESVTYTDRMCIIVVDIASYAGSAKIGITTDEVVEVSDVKETMIEDTPSFGDKVNTGYIVGMAKMKGGVTTLLDIEKVLT